jgi:hypothetical protein
MSPRPMEQGHGKTDDDCHHDEGRKKRSEFLSDDLGHHDCGEGQGHYFDCFGSPGHEGGVMDPPEAP